MQTIGGPLDESPDIFLGDQSFVADERSPVEITSSIASGSDKDQSMGTAKDRIRIAEPRQDKTCDQHGACARCIITTMCI